MYKVYHKIRKCFSSTVHGHLIVVNYNIYKVKINIHTITIKIIVQLGGVPNMPNVKTLLLQK